MAILHKNFAQTTLAAAITDTSGTSITVTSEASFPAVQFIISIDTEAMLVTNVATTTWTVTRGYEGSTAATHLNGATIYHDWSAAEADSTVHGPASVTTLHIAQFDGTTGKLLKDGGVLGTMAAQATGSYTPNTTYDAQTLLVALTDNTPTALSISEQTVLGRLTGGDITALTASNVRTLLGITAAGAALIDDANAAAQLVTIGALPIAGGTLTGAAEAADHGTASTDQVVNVCYGTADPPAANTTTEGALFIKYTA
jgi:hypothetical protein